MIPCMSDETLWLYVYRPFVSLALLGGIVLPIAFVIRRFLPRFHARFSEPLTEQQKIMAAICILLGVAVLGALLSNGH